MADLFSSPIVMNDERSKRQELCVQKWIDNKLKGTLQCCTGFGKTRTAILAIKRFLNKNPDKTILIIVPTEVLLSQWATNLAENKLLQSCSIKIINSVSMSSNTIYCDMLIVDEIHRAASPEFRRIFDIVSYKIILGLTATFDRLDGEEKVLNQYCPVIDKITLAEALQHNWLSPYREYKILLDVDLTQYRNVDKEFRQYFSYFGEDFNLAMECITNWKARNEVAKEKYTGNDPRMKNEINKQVLANAAGFSRTLQARKSFIYNHPKKLEIANLILSYRSLSKCITFSPTVEIAEAIKYGEVTHSKQTKKKREQIINKFKDLDFGVLNSVKALDEGVDIPGLNLAIILSNSSSDRQKVQRLGRVIRFEKDKQAEIFTLVLKGTVEEAWFYKSSQGTQYITLDEENLINLLENRPIDVKKNKETSLKFRF